MPTLYDELPDFTRLHTYSESGSLEPGKPGEPGYRLFIDDEREPAKNDTDMVVVRSYKEAVAYMTRHGCPIFASFDHDLGSESPSGYFIAEWMVERDLNSNRGFIPVDFDFYVHSQNPVGAANIRNYLSNYLNHRNEVTS
jgi:hypothetical protein